MKKIFELKMEINRLLEERPEYKPYQKSIEERLNKAHTQHNRLVVMHEMLMEKVRELYLTLKK